MGAVRGTTPDYVLTLDGYDLTGKTVFVTLAQGGIKTTLTGDRLTIVAGEDGSSVAFELTQAETLRFKRGTAEVQLKCIDDQGNVDASGIGQLTIDRALLAAVLVAAVIIVRARLPDPDLIDYDAPGVDITSEGPEGYTREWYKWRDEA